MAVATLAVAERFPPGTTVGAYPASNWMAHLRPPQGAPVGAPAVSAVVAVSGALAFTGLVDGASYYAYALVDGQHRYVAFRADAANAGTGAVPDASGSAKGVVRLSVEPGADPVAVATDDPRMTDARLPLVHGHLQSDVVGLTAALAAKAASVHAHAQADVAGLVADLGAKQTASAKGQADGYAALDSGVLVPRAQLGTGTANAGTFLRGDGAWSTPPAGVSVDDGPRVSGAAGRLFERAGVKLSSMDRVRDSISNQAVLASGTIAVGPLGLLRAGDSLAALAFYAATTAGASITNSWAGIARVSSRQVLAVSPTNATAAWGANTARSFAFGAAFTASADELLFWFLMVAATTVPSLAGQAVSSTALHAGPIVVGRANTGQTTPLAVGAFLAALTAGGAQVYAEAS